MTSLLSGDVPAVPAEARDLDRPDSTDPADPRRHLVVIGNGMAGARAVEEILAHKEVAQ